MSKLMEHFNHSDPFSPYFSEFKTLLLVEASCFEVFSSDPKFSNISFPLSCVIQTDVEECPADSLTLPFRRYEEFMYFSNFLSFEGAIPVCVACDETYGFINNRNEHAIRVSPPQPLEVTPYVSSFRVCISLKPLIRSFINPNEVVYIIRIRSPDEHKLFFILAF